MKTLHAVAGAWPRFHSTLCGKRGIRQDKSGRFVAGAIALPIRLFKKYHTRRCRACIKIVAKEITQ